MPGITAEVLLDILKLDVPVESQDFTIEELREAPEIFLVASNKEVVPITKLDGKPVGAGLPGPVTREAMRQWREFTLNGSWK